MDAPPPARIPWNRWTELSPPALGSWTPSRRVSVVVAEGDGLAPTLAALGEQTYPRELIEILVPEGTEAVDGLDSVSVEGGRDPVELAGGVILLFLDGALAPSAQALEAHARWHHLVSDAAVIAPRSQRQERELERTGDLADDRLDPFTIGMGPEHSLRAETLAQAGGRGTPEAGGVELAYRLWACGTVLVPDRDAVDGEAVDLDERIESWSAELADRIPLGDLRAGARGRIFSTPAMTVTMTVLGEPLEVVTGAVDAALGGSFRDLAVSIDLPEGHAHTAGLERAFASDPRVSVTRDGSGPTMSALSPFQVFLPASALADGLTFEDIHDVITEEPLGALYVTVPGRPASEATASVFLGAALARSRRIAEREGGGEEALVAELFGQRWISGVEVGMRDWREPEPRLADQGPLATMPELVRERARAAREKARAERERAEARRDRARAKEAERELARAREQAERAREQAERAREQAERAETEADRYR